MGYFIEEREANFRTLLKNESGKRVLEAILDYCGVNRSIFDTDPLKMARNAGRQDVARFIIDAIDGRESEISRMVFEYQKEQEMRRAAEAESTRTFGTPSVREATG